ncbi:uncharacterized protein Z519_06279 [Cladophialophora bantiana CBS 173.52]|uniref:F-box domain-containing protein n=1 Tax=Cladophialophora bantiana (strain ATCC 10958 / CBS 173.52 / CDC B-1940 / NIH 8579) TaxID=1442370 RepID=A0A0D2IA60_CLAB1|nr:uncharacterized protein Z519_06279 [Cladophialophora bantiana CBS 173.52]KIW93674.1 hypothetical protein Z519_06279 [Cladophialophora bantiana CBS 173.52]
MSSRFSQLPFDVLHQIASQLDICSFDRLAKTSKSLRRHLQNENTAKHAIQASLRHCLWVQLALSPAQPGPRQTLARVVDSHSALQQASPYSACIIAYANSFSYNLGILCYTTSNTLRILNFNDRRDTEKVFGSGVFTDQLSIANQEEASIGLESIKSIQVQSYADGMVVLQCDFGPFGQYILAVNIDDKKPSNPSGYGPRPRVRLCVPIRSNNKLFVRNNDRFIVLGSHSATGSHNHHEWLLDVYSLETSESVTAQPLQLRDFYGSEIGSTACFTIYQDEFYAVASQTSFESEEVDWTSYYHVIKFRLDDPDPELTIKLIWRRQHLEGPINDAWNDLGFQIDYSTGELLVVEGRKEWLNGGSRSIRTYYTQPIRRADFKDLKEGLRHPPNDRLSTTLDEHNNSRWEESMVRADRYVHAEFRADGSGQEMAKEYIRAKTKWNGYSFNAQAFVDLVTDDVVMEGEWRPRQRIKLRVVSRQELSPLVQDTVSPVEWVLRKRIRDREGQEMEDGERAFTPSSVCLWPRDDAPQDLHEILCPKGRAGDVKAMLGDEGIIYMAGPPREPGSEERALVFVCFDPTFGFQGMRRLDGSLARPRSEKKRKMEEYREFEVDVLQQSVNVTQSPGVEVDLMDGTKRLKLEARAKAADVGDSTSSPSRGDEQEITVPPQGHRMAQALGLDPAPLADMTQDWLPSTASSSELPPTLQSPRTVLSPGSNLSLRPPSPSSPAASRPQSASQFVPGSDTTRQTGQSHGKGKGPAPPPNRRLTWREKAMYMAIGKGYWLR